MQEKILILDFGSQYTQLIARRVRELNVYCEIHPYNHYPEIDSSVRGVILSGSPSSVRDKEAPQVDLAGIKGRLPLLGVCYGAQYLAHHFGGEVAPSDSREYGRAMLSKVKGNDPLIASLGEQTQVWMSHGDTIVREPDGCEIIASTEDVRVAAFHIAGEQTWGIQFHPEVYHSTEGIKLLKHFVVDICGCRQDWTPASYIETTVRELRDKLGNDKVVLGLSGGVDSSVAAVLLHKAIGANLTCIFVDMGLLRKDEFSSVLDSYKNMGLNVIGVDAGDKFLGDLKGVTDPEQKRKIIGRDFIEVFDAEAQKLRDVRWLAQGTIYPDIIESGARKTGGKASTIKSHHNLIPFPEGVSFELIEPLDHFFKDEVRALGTALGLPGHIVHRQPFPGPGLAIRIIGEVTPEKLALLKDADAIVREELDAYNAALAAAAAEQAAAASAAPTSEIELVRSAAGGPEVERPVWQYFAVLPDIKSVGVMGDERTYGHPIILRAVESSDAMTADWAKLPYELLGRVSSRIVAEVPGVNRVVYDVTPKPPGTVEWE